MRAARLVPAVECTGLVSSTSVDKLENALLSVDLSDPSSAQVMWKTVSLTIDDPTTAPVPTMERHLMCRPGFSFPIHSSEPDSNSSSLKNKKTATNNAESDG